MRKYILTLSIAFLAFMFGACAAKKVTIAMSQSDADRAAALFPGATIASLSEGKLHYENHCGSCHGLKALNSEDEAGWRNIVPDMAQKAEIDSKKENLILQYVVTMCKAPSH